MPLKVFGSRLEILGSMAAGKISTLLCSLVVLLLPPEAALAIQLASDDLTITPIFIPSPRYPCFRQPAILAAGNKLLAFAENRNVTACAPAINPEVQSPNEVGSMLVRVSTDAGVSWGDVRPVAGTVGNIDFYSVVYDSVTDQIRMILQHEETPAGAATMLVSRGGLNWTTEGTIDLEELRRGDIAVSKPAVGHGIQIMPHLCPGGCEHAGRLVIPMVCTNKTATGSHTDKGCTTCNSCLLLSDDNGRSWQLGAIGQQGTREAQVVQLPSTGSSAALYATERNMGPHPGHRQYGISSNGGDSFEVSGTDPTLTSPVTPHWTGIVGSVNSIHNGTTLIYSGPGSTSQRKQMSIHTSRSGRVWSVGKTLWEGLAGYSDLAASPDGDGLVIIFENGETTFADFVSVAKIPGSWLPPTIG